MDFIHRWRWDGYGDILVFDESDPDDPHRLTERYEWHNQICDTGRNLIADILGARTTTGLNISYVALGSDNGTITPVATTNTQLGAEQFRKAYTSSARSATGANQTIGYIAPNEACSSGGTGTNFTINEIGWFAGAATSTANSGILVARILYTRAKAQTESLQITRTDQF